MKLLQASTARDPMGPTARDEAGHLSQPGTLWSPGRASSRLIAAAGIVHDLGNLIQIAFSAINIVSRTPDMPAIHSGPVLARAKASLEQAGSIVRQCISQARDCVGCDKRPGVRRRCRGIDRDDWTRLASSSNATSNRVCPRSTATRWVRRAVLNLVFNARDAIAGMVSS